MKRDYLIKLARTVVEHLKREEKKKIGPYASFADQIIALMSNGQVASQADINRVTRMSYSRPRMNRQWRTFGKAWEENRRQLNQESLLYFFGVLKRLLTIESKKEKDQQYASGNGN